MIDTLLASYCRAGNWLLPVLRRERELARLPVARIGPCDVHFALGGGEYLAYFGISPRRETLRQRAIRLAIGMAAGPFGAMLTLQPDAAAGKDVLLWEGDLNGNYGASQLGLGMYNQIGAKHQQSLLQFDISGISRVAIVSDSVLTLVKTGGTGIKSYNVAAYRVLRAWVEGTKNGTTPADGATWNTYDGTSSWGTDGCNNTSTDRSGSGENSQLLAMADVSKSWSIPEMTRAWVTTPGSNKGVILLTTDTYSTNGLWYPASSDGTTAAIRPQFVVTYTLPAGGGALRSPFDSPFTGAF